MSKEYKKTVIVGYNPDGSSITQQELRNRVKASSKSVKIRRLFDPGRS